MSAQEHPLLRFYRGEGPDAESRFLRDIRRWDARHLEGVHDYIQWLFPLRTMSQFNSDAPILNDALIETFRADDALRAELLASFRQLLAFYGFELHDADGKPTVTFAPDAEARQRHWLNVGNHNMLRITRILSCLCTLGLRLQAEAFLAVLEDLYTREETFIGSRTMGFWREAVARDALL